MKLLKKKTILCLVYLRAHGKKTTDEIFIIYRTKANTYKVLNVIL